MADPAMDLRQRATIAALAKMFRADGYFDICTIDSLVKVWNIAIPADTYATLRLLHCVSYSQMPQGTREDLVNLVVGLMRSAVPEANWSQEIFGPKETTAKRSFLGRLVSGA